MEDRLKAVTSHRGSLDMGRPLDRLRDQFKVRWVVRLKDRHTLSLSTSKAVTSPCSNLYSNLYSNLLRSQCSSRFNSHSSRLR